MYESYYGLNAKPFRLTPDSRMLYVSSGHKRALSYLRYGIYRAEGFITVLGPPGTGKTSLVQTVISEISEGEIVVAKIVTTQLDADDALRAFAASVGLEHEGLTKAGLLNRIERFLREQLKQHKRVLLLVDEAQHLSREALEELRMLTNFQEGEHALMQCFLIGQEELRDVLARKDMEQLQQRVIASCNLRLLTHDETVEYIEHRLTHCGWDGEAVFSPEAYELIYQYTTGNPRRINDLCERLMLRGYLDECYLLNGDITFEVIEEIETDRGSSDALVELREFKKSLTGARRALKLADKTTPAAVAATDSMVAAVDVDVEETSENKSLYAFPELPEDFVDKGEFSMPAEADVVQQEEAAAGDADKPDVAVVDAEEEEKETPSVEETEDEQLAVTPSDLSEEDVADVREAVESSADENKVEADAYTFSTTSDEYQASFFESTGKKGESPAEDEASVTTTADGFFAAEDEAKLGALAPEEKADLDELVPEDSSTATPDGFFAAEDETKLGVVASEEKADLGEPMSEDSSASPPDGFFDAEDEEALSKEAAEPEAGKDDGAPFVEEDLEKADAATDDTGDTLLDAIDEQQEAALVSMAVSLFLAINSDKDVVFVPVSEQRKVMEMHWCSTSKQDKDNSSKDEPLESAQDSDDVFSAETQPPLENDYKQDPDQPDPTPYFGDEKSSAEMPKTDKFYYASQDKKLEVKGVAGEGPIKGSSGWRQYIVKIGIGIAILVVLFIVFLPAPKEPWELEPLEQKEMGSDEMLGAKDVLLTNPPLSEQPD